MNITSFATRLFSLITAVLLTATMLTGIDTLARSDIAADSLLSQTHTVRPA